MAGSRSELLFIGTWVPCFFVVLQGDILQSEPAGLSWQQSPEAKAQCWRLWPRFNTCSSWSRLHRPGRLVFPHSVESPGQPPPRQAGPHPKSTSLLCLSFRHCLITANMYWRRTAIVRQLLKARKCTWHWVLESKARNRSSTWLVLAEQTRDFQKSGGACWHGPPWHVAHQLFS